MVDPSRSFYGIREIFLFKPEGHIDQGFSSELGVRSGAKNPQNAERIAQGAPQSLPTAGRRIQQSEIELRFHSNFFELCDDLLLIQDSHMSENFFPL